MRIYFNIANVFGEAKAIVVSAPSDRDYVGRLGDTVYGNEIYVADNATEEEVVAAIMAADDRIIEVIL